MRHLYQITVSLLLVLYSGCAPLKAVVRGVNDVAQSLCELFYREHPEKLPAGLYTSAQARALNIADAARVACETQEVLEPFIEHVTSVSRVGISVTAPLTSAASLTSAAPLTSAAAAAPPSASASSSASSP